MSTKPKLPAPLSQTTGRRKAAVARVRVRTGQGKITVNRQAFDDYFSSATHRMVVTEPLRLTNLAEGYDIDATIDGGGVSGQAGAMRLGIARSLVELDPELRADPQEGRPAHPRRPREGEQEVRPQEGPQGAPVLEAVAGRGCCGSAPTASVGSPTPSSVPSWSWPSGRAAARALPAPMLPRRARHPAVGPAAAGGAVGRHGQRGRRRRRPRCPPHPRRGVALRAARGCPARRRLGLAQPLRRQRRQALRRRRPQAARRHRGRRRGRARPRPRPLGSAVRSHPSVTGSGRLSARSPTPPTGTSTTSWRRSKGATSTGCGSWSTAPTAPPRPSPRSSSSAWGPTCDAIACDARRDEHQRRLRVDPPRVAGRRGGGPGRGPRPGPRRRRRPARRRGPHRCRRHRRRAAVAVRHRPGRPRAAWPATRWWSRSCPTSASAWPWPSEASPSARPRSATATSSRRSNADGLTLGGEQSGHIVFRELATTGDGVLTGVLLLDLLGVGPTARRVGARRSCSRLPQVLVNVAAPSIRPQRGRGADGPGRGGRGGSRARRRRPGAPAGQRHRAPRPGHGRGRERGGRPRRAARLCAVVERPWCLSAPDGGSEPPRASTYPPDADDALALGPCAASSEPPVVARSSTSCSRAWSASSTGATTRPEWPCSPTAACGGPGRRPGHARSRIFARSWRTAPARCRPASATPGGPRTATPRRRTPTPSSTAPAASPSSTTASSRTGGSWPPGCATSGHVFVSDTDTEVFAHLVEEELAGGGVAGRRRARRRCATSGGPSPWPSCPRRSRGPSSPAAACSPLIIGMGDGDSPARAPRLRHPRAARPHPALLGARRRPGRGAAPRLDARHDPAGQGGRAQRAASRLGPRGRRKGRVPRLHGQGDPRAAPGRSPTPCSAGSSPTAPSSSTSSGSPTTSCAQVDKVFVVACGSSYHAGMVAKYAIERWARLPTEIDIASEFRYRDPVLDDRTLVVGVSQSGETIDTLQAMREARQWDAKILVISNVVDSSMAREADGVLYTRAGPEVGVAADQDPPDPDRRPRAAGALPGPAARARWPPPTPAVLFAELAELPGLVEQRCPRARGRRRRRRRPGSPTTRDFFFLGRHVGFPVALEGALKLKEISYLRAEGYPAGELKHGPIALIEPGTVVVGVATRTHLWEKMMGNVAEVRSPGGHGASWWPTKATRRPPPRPTRSCGCPTTAPAVRAGARRRPAPAVRVPPRPLCTVTTSTGPATWPRPSRWSDGARRRRRRGDASAASASTPSTWPASGRSSSAVPGLAGRLFTDAERAYAQSGQGPGSPPGRRASPPRRRC